MPRAKKETIAQAVQPEVETTEEQLRTYADRGIIVVPPGMEGSVLITEISGRAARKEAMEFPAIIETNLQLDKATYRKVIQSCRYLAHTDSLVSNFIDAFIEMNAGGFENRIAGGNASKTNKQTYKVIFDVFCKQVNYGKLDKSRGMDEVMKKFIWNWWVHGMMVWIKIPGQQNVAEKKSKKFKMPVELEVLDAMRVDLDKLKTNGIVSYEFPDATRTQIKAMVKANIDPLEWAFMALWPEKLSPEQALQGNWITRADALKLIQSSKPVPLPPDCISVVRRVFDDSQIYPVPYLVRYFNAAMDKNTLREMDRSIMRKIINLMLIIYVSPTNPTTPNAKVTPSMLQAAVQGVTQRIENSPDRLQIAAVPFTHKYEYVTVPSDAMFKLDHYKVLSHEGVSSLLGLTANQMLSPTGATDVSQIVKCMFGKNELCIQSFRRFMEELYDRDIIIPNNMQFDSAGVNLVFKRISILETDAFKTFIRDGVKAGYLPAKIAIDHTGEDYEWVKDVLEQEAQDRVDRGIFIGYPAYNQTTLNPGLKTKDENTQDQLDNQDVTNPQGKPSGSPNENEMTPAE